MSMSCSFVPFITNNDSYDGGNYLSYKDVNP